MDWRIIALIAPLFFVSYQALSKLLPQGISIFLVNAYAGLMGAIVMLVIHLLTATNKSLALSARYLTLAFAIGLFITFGNFVVMKAYALGAPQASFSSIFNPLFIIYGVLFGLLIWHEKLNLGQVGGIILSILGVVAIFYFKK